MPTLKLLLLAIAITGLPGRAILFVMEWLRRRSDVLNRMHDADPDAIAYEASPDMAYELHRGVAAEEEARPTFEPLSGSATTRRASADSIEEALRA